MSKFSGEFEEEYYNKQGYIPLDPNTFYDDIDIDMKENIVKEKE
jgi:hypothetical protein